MQKTLLRTMYIIAKHGDTSKGPPARLKRIETMLIATLDRQSADHALLCVSDGRVFDVYADDWQGMEEEANSIAGFYGIEIETFNPQLPE